MATDNEMESLRKNKTRRELVHRPTDKEEVLDVKWIYKENKKKP